MSDHPSRRISDTDILAGFVERLPKWWGAIALVFVGISSYAISSYKLRESAKVSASDHVELQTLKIDVAMIRGKVEQIDDMKEEIHEMRTTARQILRKLDRDGNVCFSDEDITERIVESVRAALDTKKRR